VCPYSEVNVGRGLLRETGGAVPSLFRCSWRAFTVGPIGDLIPGSLISLAVSNPYIDESTMIKCLI
jgi:hypothetical protein